MSANFETLFVKAEMAGIEAATKCVPVPMIVQQRANPLDDHSPVVKQYAPVMDGVCGFAWVIVRPGNCSFANWLKKNGHGSSAYGGGVQIWVSRYNQSMTKKEAHAHAMAKVLAGAGIRAYACSRMD